MGWETLIPAVVVVSASGVLAPGPLFLATVSHGFRHGAVSGFMASLGHMVFEMPLVFLIALGLSAILGERGLIVIVGAAGSAAIIIFGAVQIVVAMRSYRRGDAERLTGRATPSAFIAGLVFTALNPYFIVWWLTVGARLVLEALLLASLLGVLIMYAAHIWMDYAWLVFVAHVAGRTGRIMHGRANSIALITLGALMMVIGFKLLLDMLAA